MKFSSIKRALVPAVGEDMPALPLGVAQGGYPPTLPTPDLVSSSLPAPVTPSANQCKWEVTWHSPRVFQSPNSEWREFPNISQLSSTLWEMDNNMLKKHQLMCSWPFKMVKRHLCVSFYWIHTINYSLLEHWLSARPWGRSSHEFTHLFHTTIL